MSTIRASQSISNPQRTSAAAPSSWVSPPRSQRPNTQAKERAQERLRALKIEYIPSEDFTRPDAEHRCEPSRRRGDRAGAAVGRGERVLSDVGRMCQDRLLTPDEELELFRRMNYLKFKADTRRSKGAPGARAIAEVERLMNEATAVRNAIVRANMRLVVANAKRFINANNSFDELVSEGSVALLRAVEKFDYSRGNRFSTYATRSIRNNLFHLVIDRQRARNTVSLADDELLRAATDDRAIPAVTEKRLGAAKAAIRFLLERLDAQERKVIVSRFGLATDAASKTLKEIAGEMGISRERVRQIEGRALRTLHRLAEHLDVEICIAS